MASWQKFQSYALRLARGELNLETDTIKLVLSASLPNLATASVLADVSQITAGNGYVADGFALANKAFGNVAGLVTVDFDDFTLTASGGAIADFRYVTLFDDTVANDPLIQVGDLGSLISLSDGESYRFEWGNGGLITVNGANA